MRVWSLAMLLAVASPAVSAADRPASATFVSQPWGLTIRYPADLRVSTTFAANIFDRGAWRVSYAADTGFGDRIVAFSLPNLHAEDAGGESNATASLRIGASRDPSVVESCPTYGMNSGDNVEEDTRTIGGVAFREVPDNGDAGMGQTMKTDDFRAVRDGACYAIDLVIYGGGSASKVLAYDPARIAALRGVLDTISFD